MRLPMFAHQRVILKNGETTKLSKVEMTVMPAPKCISYFRSVAVRAAVRLLTLRIWCVKLLARIMQISPLMVMEYCRVYSWLRLKLLLQEAVFNRTHMVRCVIWTTSWAFLQTKDLLRFLGRIKKRTRFRLIALYWLTTRIQKVFAIRKSLIWRRWFRWRCWPQRVKLVVKVKVSVITLRMICWTRRST